MDNIFTITGNILGVLRITFHEDRILSSGVWTISLLNRYSLMEMLQSDWLSLPTLSAISV